jgi:hypothetical protein
MGKWMNEILRSQPPAGAEDHIPLAGIARLADGRADPKLRDRYAAHLNNCRECYQLLQETLIDLPEEIIAGPVQFRWRGKRMMAMAASFILVLLIGGIFIFTSRQPPHFQMASLTMDQGLMDILVEDDTMIWEKGERVDRLAALLRSKGLEVHSLDRVVLSAPYFASKSFVGPREIITIRIENHVAYLEVKREKTEKEKMNAPDSM